jgi:hypothetical protein
VPDICRDIQLHTDVWLGVNAENQVWSEDVVAELQQRQDIELLRVADYLLSTSPHSDGSLEPILLGARSKWTVGERDGRPGLVDRVSAGVQDAAEALFTRGEAGRVLARAWAMVHGLDPKPSAAYADAVVAVEIVAIGTVQPTHTTATLGTVIGQMKADGDWRLPLREHPDAPGAELLISMLRTLWHGHRDRHGKVDYSDVTVDEARAAVSLAVSLVDWFDSGVIARRSAP